MFDLSALFQVATATIATWAPKLAGATAVLAIGWLLAGLQRVKLTVAA